MTLVGHRWAIEHLCKQNAHQRLRQAYLLWGPEHVGKTTLALTFGMLLNCERPNGPLPCGACRSCVRISHNAHPDVTVTEPQGTTFTISQVRDLQAELPLTPKESRFKVRILTDLHMASREAQNSLLKTLEEPPAHALLFLTAIDSGLLAPTIVSRCQVLPLRPVPLAELEAALIERGVSPAEARALAAESGGRPGWALRALTDKKLRQERAKALEAARILLHQRRFEKLQYAEALARRERTQVLETLRLWQLWWHELLLICSGVSGSHHLLEDQESFTGAALGTDEIVNFIKQIRRTEALIARNVNLRLALDVLMLRMPYVPASQG